MIESRHARPTDLLIESTEPETQCCPRCGKRQGDKNDICFSCWEDLEILRDSPSIPVWVDELPLTAP